MGAYGNTTTGVTSAIRSFIKTTGSSAVQVVRNQKATNAPAPTSWPATAVGSPNVLAADVDRTSLLIVSRASTEVWVRFDGTTPTLALHSYYLAPGDRWEVPEHWAGCAVSLAASADGGYVLLTAGTDA